VTDNCACAEPCTREVRRENQRSPNVHLKAEEVLKSKLVQARHHTQFTFSFESNVRHSRTTTCFVFSSFLTLELDLISFFGQLWPQIRRFSEIWDVKEKKAFFHKTTKTRRKTQVNTNWEKKEKERERELNAFASFPLWSFSFPIAMSSWRIHNSSTKKNKSGGNEETTQKRSPPGKTERDTQ
jgi:hypothetical protein